MQITGKITLINPTQSVGAAGFLKREFVVTTAEQYPQQIKLEFVKDKCGLLDNFSLGQSVSVDFNLRGNEYQGKYYVSLQAWKITADAAAPGNQSFAGTKAQQVSAPPQQVTQDVQEDSIPF